MVFNNKSLVMAVLDLYSEKTNIPIAFVYNNNIIWQSATKYCSPYCIELNKLDNKCSNDHISRSKINEEKQIMCHAGLWNYVLPINRDGKTVGALLTGQRRLRSKDQDSLEVLISLKDKMSEDKYSSLKKLFYETPVIDEFDINQLKTLKIIEDKLFEIYIANELEKRKILNLAHEFLLPIQSIIANAENLRDELSLEKGELKEQAEEIVRQIMMLGKTAENMRSNLMGSQSEKYYYTSSDISELLKDIVNIFRGVALRKNVDFKIDIRSSEIPMSHDNLSRAFFNLIHNAVKYSYFSLDDTNMWYNKDRYIEIIGKERRDYYTIEITNYGIGILDEEIVTGKIFTDGYRGILSSDRERTGSGIGLSEAKRIIEQHQGNINISSDFVGYEYLFCWNDNPTNFNFIKLIDYFKQRYGIKWTREPIIQKIDTDNISIFDGKNSISLILNDENDSVIVTINEERKYDFIVKNEDKRLKIYDGNKISGPYLTKVLVKLPKFRS